MNISDDYLIISMLITALFSTRRIFYRIKNKRGLGRRTAILLSDAIVLLECLIFLNPFLFKMLVTLTELNPTVLAFIYAGFITACFLVSWTLVQKEIGTSDRRV